MNDPVFIHCEEIACENGIGVHWRHAENFSGRFYCAEHSAANDPTNVVEVTC